MVSSLPSSAMMARIKVVFPAPISPRKRTILRPSRLRSTSSATSGNSRMESICRVFIVFVPFNSRQRYKEIQNSKFKIQNFLIPHFQLRCVSKGNFLRRFYYGASARPPCVDLQKRLTAANLICRSSLLSIELKPFALHSAVDAVSLSSQERGENRLSKTIKREDTSLYNTVRILFFRPRSVFLYEI